MIFATIILVTALALAGTAASFSVFGIAAVVPAIFWQAVALASVLEVGKLVAASFLYQHWRTAPFGLRYPLSLFALALVIVTTVGVFGFMSKGYQESAKVVETMESKVGTLTERKANLKDQLDTLNKRLDNTPNAYINEEREKLKTSRVKQVKNTRKELNKVTSEIEEIKAELVEREAHLGPIVYASELANRIFGLNISREQALSWAVLIPSLILDPLAFMMILAANHVVMVNRKRGIKTPGFWKETQVDPFEVRDTGEDFRKKKLNIRNIRRLYTLQIPFLPHSVTTRPRDVGTAKTGDKNAGEDSDEPSPAESAGKAKKNHHKPSSHISVREAISIMVGTKSTEERKNKLRALDPGKRLVRRKQRQ